MNRSEPGDPGSLDRSLGALAAITLRIDGANQRYDAVVQAHLRPARPMKRPTRTRWKVLAGIATLFAAGLVSDLGAVTSYLCVLAIAISLVLIGVVVLVRHDLGRTPAVLALCDGAFLIYEATGALFLPLPITGFAIVGVVAAPVIALFVKDALVPERNWHLAQRNKRAYDNAVENAWQELAPIAREIDDVRMSYRDGHYRSWFPETYLDSVSVNALWQIVRDRRASTIQEAVNTYVQDLHNQYMRNAADGQLALAQAQIAEQRRTQQAVRVGAIANLGMQALQGDATRRAINNRY